MQIDAVASTDRSPHIKGKENCICIEHRLWLIDWFPIPISASSRLTYYAWWEDMTVGYQSMWPRASNGLVVMLFAYTWMTLIVIDIDTLTSGQFPRCHMTVFKVARGPTKATSRHEDKYVDYTWLFNRWTLFVDWSYQPGGRDTWHQTGDPCFGEDFDIYKTKGYTQIFLSHTHTHARTRARTHTRTHMITHVWNIIGASWVCSQIQDSILTWRWHVHVRRAWLYPTDQPIWYA
jgi:hypothetical protein